MKGEASSLVHHAPCSMRQEQMRLSLSLSLSLFLSLSLSLTLLTFTPPLISRQNKTGPLARGEQEEQLHRTRERWIEVGERESKDGVTERERGMEGEGEDLV